MGFAMMFLYYSYLCKCFINMIFDELFLLHPPLDFKFVSFIGIEIGSYVFAKKLKSIENVRNTWHAFQCKGCTIGNFCSPKLFGSFTIARPLFMQICWYHGFILFDGVIEMDVKNFIVGRFYFVIIIVVAFSFI